MHGTFWGWQVSELVPWRLPKLQVFIRPGKSARRKITCENTTFVCSPLLSYYKVSISKYNCIELRKLANRKKENTQPQTKLGLFLFLSHLVWQEFPRLTCTSTYIEPVLQRMYKCCWHCNVGSKSSCEQEDLNPAYPPFPAQKFREGKAKLIQACLFHLQTQSSPVK